jgi:hypothetical protein
MEKGITIYIKEKGEEDYDAGDFFLKKKTFEELKHKIHLYQISELKHLKPIFTIKKKHYVPELSYSYIFDDYDVKSLSEDDVIVVTFYDWRKNQTRFFFQIVNDDDEVYEFQFENENQKIIIKLITYINLLKESLERKFPHTRVTIRFKKNNRKILTDSDVRSIKEGDILTLEFFFVLFFFFSPVSKTWEDITDKNTKNRIFFNEKPENIKDIHEQFKKIFGYKTFSKYFGKNGQLTPKFELRYKNKHPQFFTDDQSIKYLFSTENRLKSESILIFM